MSEEVTGPGEETLDSGSEVAVNREWPSTSYGGGEGDHEQIQVKRASWIWMQRLGAHVVRRLMRAGR